MLSRLLQRSAPRAVYPGRAAFRQFSTTNPFVFQVPTMGDSITEGTITEWQKKVGDYVAEDETFITIETDKVSVDVSATGFSGVLLEQLAKVGDTVQIKTDLAKFDTDAKPSAGGAAPAAAAAPKPAAPAPAAAAPAAAAPAAAAPAAPKPAAPTPAPKPATPAPATPAAAPVAAGERSQTRVKMTRLRQRVAERLVSAQQTGALLTTFNEVDMTELIHLRNTYKEQFEKQFGAKLGFMSPFVYACTKALQELPAVNATIQGDEIVFNNFIDISVAVSAPRGLVVPVLRNVEKMGFADIEKGIAALAKKAKDDSLTLEEMSGGTFTITNGGVFGSMMSTPLVNSPQSAILGMHAIKQRAVVMPDGKIEARAMMYVALTYDHRLIDGRESVTFLKSVKEKLEDPKKMLLGL
ncbi:hypothetical protein BASA81_000795 [Batrachochytrium salamandrivorans]|nr:hypothetical protein BASA81_000795 [Batrachochytrium salamandrivorans]